MTILIATMLNLNSNSSKNIALQCKKNNLKLPYLGQNDSSLYFSVCYVYSLDIALNIRLCFSGLSYCQRILQASSSLDRGSDLSCQSCWLGSQSACVSKINY